MLYGAYAYIIIPVRLWMLFENSFFFHIWLYPLLLLLLLLVYEMKRVKHSRGINTLTLFLSPSYFEIPRHKSIYFKSLCIIDFIIQYQKLIHLYNGVWMFEFLALSWFSDDFFSLIFHLHRSFSSLRSHSIDISKHNLVCHSS